MPDNKWNGMERRQSAIKDHDTLIEIVQILKNVVENNEKSRLSFEEHCKENVKDFNFTNRFIWGGVGIMAFVEIYLRIIGK